MQKEINIDSNSVENPEINNAYAQRKKKGEEL